MTLYLLLIFLSAFLLTSLLHRCSSGPVKTKRIILLGIDGMGISGFQDAKTPNLDKLVRTGALSLKTRAVMPTVSAPNWGSHLLGAGPEQHGITYNGWTVDNHSVEPILEDDCGYFPSVFNVIRETKSKALTGFFYDWNGLGDLYNLELIDKVEFSKGFVETFEKATPWIIENDPLFTFIYIGHPDHIGHTHQWGSKEYIEALEDVDDALGTFFKQLELAGLYDDTHFIVVTDHGGVGYGHGGLSMEEIQVPWIIKGPGIIQNRLIEQYGDVYNTAATISYLLDIPSPEEWTGRPYLGAFKSHQLADRNRNAYVVPPKSNIKSGFFPQSEAVTLSVTDPAVTIRYTLDGSEPSSSSYVYKSPILIQKTALLKAAGFMDEFKSSELLIEFRKIVPPQDLILDLLPGEKYSGRGKYSLFDREIGGSGFDDGKWLGFKGDDLLATILFEKRVDIGRVSIGILNNPGSWIFPPQEVFVMASVDGINYKEIGRLESEQIQKQLRNGRTELSIKVVPAQTAFIKVTARNYGVCPEDHPGAGETTWLFVDEIIFE